MMSCMHILLQKQNDAKVVVEMQKQNSSPDSFLEAVGRTNIFAPRCTIYIDMGIRIDHLDVDIFIV